MKEKFENLKIAKRIRTSGLAEIIKKDVLKRLKRIYSSPEEAEKCKFKDAECLLDVMFWNDTKEEWGYWNQISILLRKLEK